MNSPVVKGLIKGLLAALSEMRRGSGVEARSVLRTPRVCCVLGFIEEVGVGGRGAITMVLASAAGVRAMNVHAV
eukprot:1179330-Prorocentrum_minimum.AAC.5